MSDKRTGVSIETTLLGCRVRVTVNHVPTEGVIRGVVYDTHKLEPIKFLVQVKCDPLLGILVFNPENTFLLDYPPKRFGEKG